MIGNRASGGKQRCNRCPGVIITPGVLCPNAFLVSYAWGTRDREGGGATARQPPGPEFSSYHSGTFMCDPQALQLHDTDATLPTEPADGWIFLAGLRRSGVLVSFQFLRWREPLIGWCFLQEGGQNKESKVAQEHMTKTYEGYEQNRVVVERVI